VFIPCRELCRVSQLNGQLCRFRVLAVQKLFRPEVGTERRGDLNCFFFASFGYALIAAISGCGASYDRDGLRWIRLSPSGNSGAAAVVIIALLFPKRFYSVTTAPSGADVSQAVADRAPAAELASIVASPTIDTNSRSLSVMCVNYALFGCGTVQNGSLSRTVDNKSAICHAIVVSYLTQIPKAIRLKVKACRALLSSPAPQAPVRYTCVQDLSEASLGSCSKA
jgi:hypothetical protein